MRIKHISSRDNPEFKVLRSLLSSRGINEHKLAMISGERFVREVQANHAELCSTLLFCEGLHDSNIDQAPSELRRVSLQKALYDELDSFGTKQPLLLVKTPTLARFDPQAAWDEGLHLFVPLQNPENLGSLLRSAMAFDVKRVVLLKGAANPYHPKALRTAGANTFKANLALGPALSELAPFPVESIGLDVDGTPLRSASFPKTLAVMVGLEGSGLSTLTWHCSKVSIPMANNVESLNATVAASLMLYEYHSRASIAR